MKLLFDQNLPRSLVTAVQETFPESTHVALIDLATGTDREIFDYARDNGFVLVSKDSDFRQLSFLYGIPPKIIWLRVGNCSVAVLKEIMRRQTQRFHEFEDEEESFLVVEGDGP